MFAYLLEEPKKNKRNGTSKKTLKTNIGETAITTPTDRNSSFEPSIIKKRQTILADNLSEKISTLHGLRMSLRDISSHIEEMYDMSISHTVLSEITDRIIPYIKAQKKQTFRIDLLHCLVECYAL